MVNFSCSDLSLCGCGCMRVQVSCCSLKVLWTTWRWGTCLRPSPAHRELASSSSIEGVYAHSHRHTEIAVTCGMSFMLAFFSEFVYVVCFTFAYSLYVCVGLHVHVLHCSTQGLYISYNELVFTVNSQSSVSFLFIDKNISWLLS